MVAGEHSQAAGVDRQGDIQAVLHGEIGDGGIRWSLVPALRSEVPLELGPHGVEGGQERIIVRGLLELLLRDHPEHPHRVLPRGQPRVVVQAHEEHDGLEVPADPEIVRELLQRLQSRRDVRLDREGQGSHAQMVREIGARRACTVACTGTRPADTFIPMGIFKSYDIRGVFDREWNGATAHAIGRHLPGLLEARRIVVGRDVRLSSNEVFAELVMGITESGCDVADIGLCDTPAVYFSTAHFDMDGSVMITASHNPPEYNGLKVSRRAAVPVGYDTGLAELERRVASGAFPAPPKSRGIVSRLDMRPDYLAHLATFKSDLSGLKAVIDCSNGMAGLFLRDVLGGTGLRYTPDVRRA